MLIDSYTQEYIMKDEFEPRIKVMRNNLTLAEENIKKLTEKKNLTQEVKLIVANLADFQGV